MIKLDKLKKAGKVLKTHGKIGELKFALDEERFQPLLNELDFVFVDNFGSKVPYRIIEVKPSATPIVNLEGIDTPEEAGALAGGQFYFPIASFDRLNSKSESDSLKKWDGFLIVDDGTGTRVGEILALHQVSSQILAEVQDPNSDRVRHIPIHPDLIQHIDEEAKVLLMNLPDGILDL